MSVPRIPVYLSTDMVKVTVFGGGNAALRRCRHFEGAAIRVVSEKTVPGFEDLTDDIVRQTIDPSTAGEFIKGSHVVIVATGDRALDDAIRDVSMSMDVLTCSANGGDDLHIPSMVRREGYTLSVSSDADVSVFQTNVMELIDQSLDDTYDMMLQLLTDLREDVREYLPSQVDRARFLAEVMADRGIWKLLEFKDLKRAHKRAMRMVEQG